MRRIFLFLPPAVGSQSGGVRGHSWIRQTLSDAREPMNLEDWFGDLLGAHGKLVTCDGYRNKLRKSLANDEPRFEVDEDGHS